MRSVTFSQPHSYIQPQQFHIFLDSNELWKSANLKFPFKRVFFLFTIYFSRFRRAAMNWVLKNRRESSILYFGDDDNTYDLRIFEEIRKTRKVSVFPVAYIGAQSISTPVVETRQVHVGDGEVVSVKKVVGFTDDWFANRKFPVDMAGKMVWC